MRHVFDSIPFNRQCTARALFLGVIGSIVITTSSLYVSLRMGSLPWPTIFAAILSMAILKLWGDTNLNEINVAHTAMSAGSMVAGGVAFTIPGIWILFPEAEVGILPLLGVTLAGTLLGVLFTASLRLFFIEKEELPFPIGMAAAQTVKTGDRGGKKAGTLFASIGVTAIVVALRDGFKTIPAALGGFWVSPMAVSIGYIIGPLYTGVWFLGAVVANWVMVPLGLSNQWFAGPEAAAAFKNSLGIGLMIGTGLGILARGILRRAKEIYAPMLKRRNGEGGGFIAWSIIMAGLAFAFTIVTGIGVWVALLTILGVWITTAMAASITGQTGINPMEIFGILVLLAARALFQIDSVEGFFVAGIVAVACGLTGDVLNDFKSGHILKTNPRAQLIAEAAGGIVGAVVSVFVLLAMYKAFGAFGPGTELIAPQAYAVSTMISGLPHVPAFSAGLAIGFILYIFKFPGMTLGLGVFLPTTISVTVFLGGLANFIVKKITKASTPDNTPAIIAAGALGGEGITGVTIAIIKVLTIG
jgi:uncharacterized oligopeptide transporter (OPT) family protein